MEPIERSFRGNVVLFLAITLRTVFNGLPGQPTAFTFKEALQHVQAPLLSLSYHIIALVSPLKLGNGNGFAHCTFSEIACSVPAACLKGVSEGGMLPASQP
jgi:hypothetical protein